MFESGLVLPRPPFFFNKGDFQGLEDTSRHTSDPKNKQHSSPAKPTVVLQETNMQSLKIMYPHNLHEYATSLKFPLTTFLPEYDTWQRFLDYCGRRKTQYVVFYIYYMNDGYDLLKYKTPFWLITVEERFFVV